jgi:hypothetical protein
MDPFYHEWSTTLVFVTIGLAAVSLLVPAFRRDTLLRSYIPEILAWRLAVFAFSVLWMLPFYATRDASDAVAFHIFGSNLSQDLANGSLGSFHWANGSSTIILLTGIAYWLIGPSIYGVYWLSAAIGLAASVILVRTFRQWYGGQSVRRYALLVLFLPSFALFSTMYGKDSLVALGLALSAYGYSIWLRHQPSKGLFVLLLGLGLLGSIRPHIAGVLTFAALTTNVVFFGRSGRRHMAGGFASLALFGILAIAGGYAIQTFVLGGAGDAESATLNVIKDVQLINQVGGSTIDIDEIATPLDVITSVPKGILTVLFRPFPWEVNGVNMLLAALENMLLSLLLIRVFWQRKVAFRAIVGDPYMVFCLAVSIGLLIILSRLPNLGLVIRERTMFQPFYFVLLSAPWRDTAQVSRRMHVRTAVAPAPEFRRPAAVPSGAKA